MNEKILPYLGSSAASGDLKAVKRLVENGADIHDGDDRALRWASEFGYPEVVRFLVENGANVHALDNYALRSAFLGGPGLYIVRDENKKNQHIKIVKFLLENGADWKCLKFSSKEEAIRYFELMLI